MDLSNKMEDSQLNLKNPYGEIVNINLKDDVLQLKNFIKTYLDAKTLKKIVNYFNKNISSFEYTQLLNLI